MAEKTFMSSQNAVAGATNASVLANIQQNTANGPGGQAASVTGGGRGTINPTTAGLYNAQVGGGRGNVNPPSAYSHNAENVVVNSDQTPGIQLKFQPNILDNYDAITYHWKFFMVSQETASSGAVMDISKQTVIAETGVTDLTIDKIEIKGITTPTVETGTGVSTNVSFEITEPSGAAMIDKIFYQSIALGIGNWSTAPFYLQLSFRSRDPDTSASVDNPVGSINDLNWLYPLKMTDIKANVTTVGTRYDCTAIIYNDLAQQNVNFELQQATTLDNVDTFADAMSRLEEKLNSDQLLKLIGTYSIPDTFKVVVDPVLAGYKITPSDQNTNSSRSNNFTVFNGKDATFPAGTSVDVIINTCLAQTKEAQMALSQSDTAGQEGKPINQEVNQMKKFWRIYTESIPQKFDPRRVSNSHSFTIYIYEYDKGILDQNSSQTAVGADTKDSIRRRLSTYLKKRILRKKYNYIFTGLNDQIINFNLELNCAFAIGKARLAGAYSNSASADKGVVYQNNSTAEAELKEKLYKAISFLNNAASANTPASNAAQSDAIASINAAALPDDTKQRYLTLLENAKPENRLNFLASASQNGIDINGQLTAAQFNAKSLAQPISANLPSFISDVDIKSPDTLAMYKQYVQYNAGKLRPISYVESTQDKSVGLGIEANSNSGIQQLSTMFSVALHGDFGGSFQKISMTIKGDPFWLFPYPIAGSNRQIYLSKQTDVDAFQWIKNAHLTSNSANLIGTDNFFALRFRTPRYYNLDTNPDDDSLTDSDTFSGIYQMITVTSRFHNGKFEQDVTANIDPLIKLSDFSKEFADDASTYDVPTTPADFLKSSVPDTAVKQNVIMGSNTSDQSGIDQTTRTINAINGTTTSTISRTVPAGTVNTGSNIPISVETISGLPPRFNT